MAWPGVIIHYRKHLPVRDDDPVVTLFEGNTPLVSLPLIARELGPNIQLLGKLEGVNPTCSFKDRGMTVAVSRALGQGQRAVICASTGNTSASAAAYASRARMRSFVLVPKGAIAVGKLAQAAAHGAQLLSVEGNFDAALDLVREISANYPVALVNSLNPDRIEGQKTAAFEICDEIGNAPDFHAIPVGNAGNIRAYWKGFVEYWEQGVIAKKPKLLGFQAEGAAPIVRGKAMKRPRTIASAIRIGNPASWKEAVAAVEESGGQISATSDEEIMAAYKLLAEKEGLFVEPASAAGVAGLLKLASAGYFRGFDSAIITCTLTGHGLKDPRTAIRFGSEPIPVPAEMDQIVEKMKLEA